VASRRLGQRVQNIGTRQINKIDSPTAFDKTGIEEMNVRIDEPGENESTSKIDLLDLAALTPHVKKLFTSFHSSYSIAL
jgi:hypothetical protein